MELLDYWPSYQSPSLAQLLPWPLQNQMPHEAHKTLCGMPSAFKPLLGRAPVETWAPTAIPPFFLIISLYLILQCLPPARYRPPMLWGNSHLLSAHWPTLQLHFTKDSVYHVSSMLASLPSA